MYPSTWLNVYLVACAPILALIDGEDRRMPQKKKITEPQVVEMVLDRDATEGRFFF